MDFFQPSPNPNKERYELMLKRRQSLLELAKLNKTILEHPHWQQISKQNSKLQNALESQIFTLNDRLCENFCQAKTETLKKDIANIYGQLVIFSKIWLDLEKQTVPVILVNAKP